MEEQQIQDLDVRLRRLEQLHVWAGIAIVTGIAFYILKNK
jgi:hypothetical protein